MTEYTIGPRRTLVFISGGMWSGYGSWAIKRDESSLVGAFERWIQANPEDGAKLRLLHLGADGSTYPVKTHSGTIASEPAFRLDASVETDLGEEETCKLLLAVARAVFGSFDETSVSIGVGTSVFTLIPKKRESRS